METSAFNSDSFVTMMDSSNFSNFEESYGDGREIAKFGNKLLEHESDKAVVVICPICNKGFKSNWGYKCHARIHAVSYGEVDNCFKCSACGNFYPTLSRLRQHVRCHSEARPFVCEKCGRAYKHKCGLKLHTCVGLNPA